MSTTAIAIADNISKIKSLIESGEFTAEVMADTLEGEAIQLSDKLDAIMHVFREKEGMAKISNEEAERFAARKKSFEREMKQLKEYALLIMQKAGEKSIKTARNTLTVKVGYASVVIDNAALLPDELVDVVTTVAPDKKKIKAAIEQTGGASIPGAHIEIGAPSLQVR